MRVGPPDVPSAASLGALARKTPPEGLPEMSELDVVRHFTELSRRNVGVIVSMATGKATFYSLDALRDRGTFFVHPQTEIYAGMVVGENCREGDIVCNLTKEKKLTNVRSSTKESFVKLAPPRAMDIEEALEYVGDDELVEITPKSVRLRKMLLNEKDRKRAK